MNNLASQGGALPVAQNEQAKTSSTTQNEGGVNIPPLRLCSSVQQLCTGQERLLAFFDSGAATDPDLATAAAGTTDELRATDIA